MNLVSLYMRGVPEPFLGPKISERRSKPSHYCYQPAFACVVIENGSRTSVSSSPFFVFLLVFLVKLTTKKGEEKIKQIFFTLERNFCCRAGCFFFFLHRCDGGLSGSRP